MSILCQQCRPDESSLFHLIIEVPMMSQVKGWLCAKHGYTAAFDIYLLVTSQIPVIQGLM